MKELLDTRVIHASDLTDVRLLQRIAARDTGALAELYDRHSRLLFGLLLRIVRDRAEAEEILQETFVRVWTRAETYDAQIGGPLPWIVRVARNGAIDRLRARRVRAPVDAIDVAAVEAGVPAAGIQTPEAAVLIAERRRTLTDALAGLPAEQRQLIEAAFFEGYTHSELAQRFGLPLGTVKTRIRAGMIATRQRVDVISGSVIVEGRVLRAGDFHHAEGDSDHGEAWTDEGVEVLLAASASDYAG